MATKKSSKKNPPKVKAIKAPKRPPPAKPKKSAAPAKVKHVKTSAPKSYKKSAKAKVDYSGVKAARKSVAQYNADIKAAKAALARAIRDQQAAYYAYEHAQEAVRKAQTRADKIRYQSKAQDLYLNDMRKGEADARRLKARLQRQKRERENRRTAIRERREQVKAEREARGEPSRYEKAKKAFKKKTGIATVTKNQRDNLLKLARKLSLTGIDDFTIDGLIEYYAGADAIRAHLRKQADTLDDFRNKRIGKRFGRPSPAFWTNRPKDAPQNLFYYH